MSVVVPAYNEQNYIVPCLEALLRQADEFVEIIVVDNNSTDATAELVRAIADENPVVRLVAESRQGLSFARNKGFEEAKGDIFGRIDADTRVRDGWAQAIKNCLAQPENANVGAVTGLNNSYDSPFRWIKRTTIEYGIRHKKIGARYNFLNLHGANMAIRRSTWEKVADQVTMSGAIHEDYDLALCVAMVPERILQLVDMWVDISPRRAFVSLIRYWVYTRAGYETCRVHGLVTITTLPVICVELAKFWIGHAIIWLPYRAYDPARRRFSVRRLFGSVEYRPTPG